MCEKQKRIEELELEVSQIRLNYAESAKLNAEREKFLIDAIKTVRDIKYQPALLITPLIVSLIALVAVIAK